MLQKRKLLLVLDWEASRGTDGRMDGIDVCRYSPRYSIAGFPLFSLSFWDARETKMEEKVFRLFPPEASTLFELSIALYTLDRPSSAKHRLNQLG